MVEKIRGLARTRACAVGSGVCSDVMVRTDENDVIGIGEEPSDCLDLGRAGGLTGSSLNRN